MIYRFLQGKAGVFSWISVLPGAPAVEGQLSTQSVGPWIELWLTLCRHPQDSDPSAMCSDADLHRHKKKKKKKKRHSRRSEDLVKDSQSPFPKATSFETGAHFRRAGSDFSLTSGLPLEGVGRFHEKTKHLRMESRDDRCRVSDCVQGKRRYLELRI